MLQMLSCHTWPQWRGPSVDGVTYLVREVPIGPGEYAFGRTKIFIRSAKTVSSVLIFTLCKSLVGRGDGE